MIKEFYYLLIFLILIPIIFWTNIYLITYQGNIVSELNCEYVSHRSLPYTEMNYMYAGVPIPTFNKTYKNYITIKCSDKEYEMEIKLDSKTIEDIQLKKVSYLLIQYERGIFKRISNRLIVR